MKENNNSFLYFSVIFLVAITLAVQAIIYVSSTAEDMDSYPASNSTSLVYTEPTTLKANEGITSASVLVPNQTWLDFETNMSYINLSSKFVYSLNDSNFTFSIWINVKGNSSTQCVGAACWNSTTSVILSKYNTVALGREYLLSIKEVNSTNYNISFETYSNASTGNSLTTLRANTTAFYNNWTYLTLTGYTNSTFKKWHTQLYINGIPSGSGTVNYTCQYNGCNYLSNFYLGGMQSSTTTPDRLLNGSLDEFRLYTRLLNDSEIEQLYTQGRNKLLTNNLGLITYLKLNENSGTTAYDSSGNGNNGTISGATWKTDGQNINLAENVDYTLNKNSGLLTLTDPFVYITASWVSEIETNDGVRDTFMLKLATILIAVGVLFIAYKYIHDNYLGGTF